MKIIENRLKFHKIITFNIVIYLHNEIIIYFDQASHFFMDTGLCKVINRKT